MEIPGNELRVKNRAIQDRIKVTEKESAKTDAASGASGTKGTQGTEQIALSSKAKDIQRAHEAVKNSSDIRVDKVERVKQKSLKGAFM